MIELRFQNLNLVGRYTLFDAFELAEPGGGRNQATAG